MTKNGEMPICDRCGSIDGTVRDGYVFTDEYGEKVRMKLCWDCDFEVMNGRGTPFDDVGEILLSRAEEDYEYDPINNPCPW